MLNKEDILDLAWEHSEGSGKRYIFTEESLFEFLKELKKEQAPVQTAPQPEQSGLVEALEKYADDRNWCFDTCKVDRDIAKDALAAYHEALSAQETNKI